MEYTIRKYKNGDGEQIVPLKNISWRSAYSHIFPEEVFIDNENKTPEKIKTFDDDLRAKGGVCYVAESNDKIIGVMIYNTKCEVEYFAKKGYAQLAVLYLHPNTQRQGVGKALFDLFVKNLKELKQGKFCIGVLKDNYNARKAYEKWGGKLTDVTVDFVKLEKPYTEVFYEYDTNML